MVAASVNSCGVEANIGAVTVPVKVGEAIGAFNAKPGTVGAAAVPPKSPANCSFPLVEASASTIVAEAIWLSTYVFTAFCVGNKTSLVPNAVTADLFAVFSLVANAAVVAVALEVTVACSAVLLALTVVILEST